MFIRTCNSFDMAQSSLARKFSPARRRVIWIVAAAVAGVAMTVAFMLWIAYTQVTDYPTYDLAYAGAFMAGIIASITIAVLALVTGIVARYGRRDTERPSRSVQEISPGR
ncbi:phage holin family protein [Rathayibacter sp. AY1D1]|uniref:phage holin family protein n=1 Tax=Rathayibacter sp. AY1D1 TaxID=2080542 RepID=UPI0011B0ADD2|nr:phage holin family protein [Rathayibacter sp. AY1D1]